MTSTRCRRCSPGSRYGQDTCGLLLTGVIGKIGEMAPHERAANRELDPPAVSDTHHLDVLPDLGMRSLHAGAVQGLLHRKNRALEVRQW